VRKAVLKLHNKLFLFLVLVIVAVKLNIIMPNFIKAGTSTSTEILDSAGAIIQITLAKDDKFRLWTDFSQISPQFKKEILNKEDRFFYYHFGANPVSLIRAASNYLFKNNSPGASTITMQLARLHFGIYTRNIQGKALQILASIAIEMSLSKEEIFEAYLNLIPMGRNIEGIETASKYYLGKASKKLNPIQVVFFSLLPQSPKRYNYKSGSYLSEISKLITRKLPEFTYKEIQDFLRGMDFNTKRPYLAPHFSRYVLGKIKSNETRFNTIKTSLNLKFQKGIEEIVKEYIDSSSAKGLVNATSLVVNSKTGKILTYVGSKDFFDEKIHGQVDGILAKRSPGSTLKPFIYALAFDQGLAIPQSIVFDGPLSFRTPENYDRKYMGPISLEEALITSRNVPAVSMNSKLSSPSFYSFLKMSAVKIDHPASHYGSSIALGALELSSLELAKIYMLLANNGELNEISFDSGVTPSSEIFLISKEASVLTKDILRKHTRPHFGKSSNFTLRKGEVYWKTGTSFGFRDAWATGIWADYVVITWVGDFKSESNPYLVGGQTAGPLFFRIIDYLRNQNLYDQYSDLQHSYSSELSTVSVCAVSGMLPNKNCSRLKRSMYIPGVSPVKKCRVHRKVELSVSSSLRTCSSYQGPVYSKVFEFFDSNKIERYRKFGLKLTKPPRFEKICSSQGQENVKGINPAIVSPKLGYTYIVDDEKGFVIIPVSINADSDVESLSIYLNEALMFKKKPDTLFSITLRPGSYQLKVIDDKGRKDERIVNVENTTL
jgi:penicillin-binding protein 1C